MKKTTLFTAMTLSLAVAQAALASGLELSGAWEVEYGQGEDFAGDSSSDVVAATFGLGMDAQINSKVNAHALFLFEEDDTEPLDTDEAFIDVDLGGATLTAGRMYVPFGVFESNLVSDPFTLEIGETRESAIMFSVENEGLYGSVYTYNGDSSDGSDDTVNQSGGQIGFVSEGNVFFDVSASFISSITDAESLTTIIDAGDSSPDDGVAEVDDYVSGTAFSALLGFGDFTVIAEQVAANDKINGGAQPTATNLEVGFDAGVGSFAVGLQSTEDSAGELPETRTAAAFSTEIEKNTSLAFEIAMDEDYSTGDGGTGDSATSFTVQLAAEF